MPDQIITLYSEPTARQTDSERAGEGFTGLVQGQRKGLSFYPVACRERENIEALGDGPRRAFDSRPRATF